MAPSNEFSQRELGQLFESVDGVREALLRLTNEVGQVKAAVQKADVERGKDMEHLTGASLANKTAIDQLRKDTEHDKQSAINRDQQQVTMVGAEEMARIKADGDIEKELKVLPAILLTNRIIIAIVGSTVVAAIGSVVSGRISIVVHP